MRNRQRIRANISRNLLNHIWLPTFVLCLDMWGPGPMFACYNGCREGDRCFPRELRKITARETMRIPIEAHTEGRDKTSQYSYLVAVLSNWILDNWVYRFPLPRVSAVAILTASCLNYKTGVLPSLYYEEDAAFFSNVVFCPPFFFWGWLFSNMTFLETISGEHVSQNGGS